MIVFSQNKTICCGNMTNYIWKIMPVADLVEDDGSPIKDAEPYEYAICCCSRNEDGIEIFAVYDSESTAKVVLKNMAEQQAYAASYIMPGKQNVF